MKHSDFDTLLAARPSIETQFSFWVRHETRQVPPTIAYRGRLRTVAANLAVDPIWGGARLLSGVADLKKLGGEARIKLLEGLTAKLLNLYALGSEREVAAINRDEDLLRYMGIISMVRQEDDRVTVRASYPSLSWRGAKAIGEKTQKPILMLALCRGGLVAATQAFLYHRFRGLGGNENYMYPVRFSCYKSRDANPHLTYDEAEHLKSLTDGRTVVVYDEVSATGETVGRAVGWLKPILKAEDIIGIVNKDARGETTIMQQGKYWEHTPSLG